MSQPTPTLDSAAVARLTAPARKGFLTISFIVIAIAFVWLAVNLHEEIKNTCAVLFNVIVSMLSALIQPLQGPGKYVGLGIALLATLGVVVQAGRLILKAQEPLDNRQLRLLQLGCATFWLWISFSRIVEGYALAGIIGLFAFFTALIFKTVLDEYTLCPPRVIALSLGVIVSANFVWDLVALTQVQPDWWSLLATLTAALIYVGTLFIYVQWSLNKVMEQTLARLHEFKNEYILLKHAVEVVASDSSLIAWRRFKLLSVDSVTQIVELGGVAGKVFAVEASDLQDVELFSAFKARLLNNSFKMNCTLEGDDPLYRGSVVTVTAVNDEEHTISLQRNDGKEVRVLFRYALALSPLD